MAEKAANFGPEVMRMAEKSLLLQLLDQSWKDHLLGLDHLRHGIQLRAYGQRDPLNEYKREAFEMFETMLDRLRETVTGVLSHIEVRASRPEEAVVERRTQPMQETRSDPALAGAGAEPEMAMAGGGRMPQRPASAAAQTMGRAAPAGTAGDPWAKTPRNALCPCGSGKKYKHCHGKL
jgi:preprotein translocase subunit SecA